MMAEENGDSYLQQAGIKLDKIVKSNHFEAKGID